MTVLVPSCDAYADILGPFAALWKRHWPDCPYKTVLLTETKGCDGFGRTIATGKGKSWCAMLAEALRQIETDRVMMVLNDYLLEADVDTALVAKRLEEAKRHNALNLRLNPNPPGRTPFPDTDLMEMPKNVAYSITCQTGIWDRRFLLGLAERNESAWEFERFGSFMLDPADPRPLLVARTKEFPFVDALHKSYWEREGAALCEREGVKADFEARGFPPLRVRAREALKAAIFAIFPWTLIVRIQNLFSRPPARPQ